MASSDTLREQVVQAIAAADKGAWEASGHTAIVAGEYEQADAAIRVVLAAVAEQIEALRQYGTPEAAAERAVLTKVLAVVERLGAVSDGE